LDSAAFPAGKAYGLSAKLQYGFAGTGGFGRGPFTYSKGMDFGGYNFCGLDIEFTFARNTTGNTAVAGGQPENASSFQGQAPSRMESGCPRRGPTGTLFRHGM